jgi:hypothetical protein
VKPNRLIELSRHLPSVIHNVTRTSFFLKVGFAASHPLFLFIIQNFFKDHAYVLAFSLIMLHTDAFNPSNKRKMTKEDYTKNAKLPGVPIEVLDVSYNLFVNIPWLT